MVFSNLLFVHEIFGGSKSGGTREIVGAKEESARSGLQVC